MQSLADRSDTRMRSRLRVGLATLVLAVGLLPAGTVSAQAQRVEREPDVVVCETCPVTSLAEALELAPTAGLIEVRGGRHAGPFVIERDLELRGVDEPIIDGGGSGTVVTIRGAAVAISGFTIRGTGTSLHHEDSAILVDSGRGVIEHNRIEDALFGLYVKNSPGSILRGNLVLSKAGPVASRGDGIRIWYCDDVLIEDNIVQDGRDVILWYSNRGVVRGNQFDRSRYGLHLMFSDDAQIAGNSLRANSIGLYVMYSRNVTITANSLSDNHGPSGGGLGLKDVDGAEISGNRFVNNRIGAQIDTSPREPNIIHHWSGNVFAYNQAALGLMPAVRNNAFSGNAFIDNLENVTVLGGGQLRDIVWAVDGRGNYWSDYTGYDADGDGVGDVPYRSQQLFESLMDRQPALRLFIFSPAAMAIDFAARAFPAVRPREKFSDPAPLMSPPAVAGLPPVARASGWERLLGGGIGLAVAAAAFLLVRRLRERVSGPANPARGMEVAHVQESCNGETLAAASAAPAVRVRGLTKRYGETIAVGNADFELAAGEAVAMWGANGAGKTTILRCLLGIARFEGTVRINGLDPVADGRAARATIGFVPQDLAPSPVPVGELVAFIARLKGASTSEALQHLDRLGIGDQVSKPVAALSGGMKQRLALALALIGAPRVLLLDEPTANLDAAGRADLLELLRTLKNDGMTLLFASHRPDDVLALADRILMLERGVITGSVTPDEFAQLLGMRARLVLTLANGHVNEAVAALEHSGHSVTVSGKVMTIPIRAQDKAQVLSILARAGVDIADFEVEREL